MRNCFQHPLQTSNDQAPLKPFDHYIKIKAYIRVGGEPRGRLSAPPPPIDKVHREEIGEIASSHLLKGIQKLQKTRSLA